MLEPISEVRMSDERYIPAQAGEPDAAGPAEAQEAAAAQGDKTVTPADEAAQGVDEKASAEASESKQLSDVDLAAVEAILFATDNALSPAKIAEVACLDGGRRAARKAIEQLNHRYE